MPKIRGIREAVRDIASCPQGFHVEIWSEMDGDDIVVWSSDLCSQNTWTTGHAPTERCLDSAMAEIREDALYDGGRISTTEVIRKAVEKVWGIQLSSPSSSTAPKTIRRSGKSLVVAITDLASVIDAEEGDTVEVTIRRLD